MKLGWKIRLDRSRALLPNKLFNLVRRRHGRLCASACHRNCRYGRGKTRTAMRRVATRKSDGEASIERVASSSCVHGVDNESRNQLFRLRWLSNQAASCAKFKQHVVDTECHKFISCCIGREGFIYERPPK